MDALVKPLGVAQQHSLVVICEDINMVQTRKHHGAHIVQLSVEVSYSVLGTHALPTLK